MNAASHPESANQGIRPAIFWIAVGSMFVLIFVSASVALSLYGDALFYGPGRMRRASGKEFEYRQPKLNPTTPPGPAPEGMVWIPGGEFWMGVEVEKYPGSNDIFDASEVHLVYVDGFWMDKTEVTNAEFARFVAATGYVTVAEKQPDPKEFPDVKPDALKPFSIVFRQPQPGEMIDLRDYRSWWDPKVGASWKHPDGPGSNIKGRENFPVVHICYHDAVAYCRWAKKRLPTEAEWEFAGRGGLDRKLYPWGDELKVDGKWMANAWQGEFPYTNTKEDGFDGAAPVASFPPNAYGLYDMSGNVWEWCADWYRKDHYIQRCRDVDPHTAIRNPTGPDSGFDLEEPGLPKRVQRGGSFLCAENFCTRYVIGTRGKGEITSAQNHCGFRCVKDAK